MKSKNFGISMVVLLLCWVSLFPLPPKEEYQPIITIVPAVFFLALLLKRRFAIFKLSDFPLWIFLIAIGVNILFARQRFWALNAYLEIAPPLFFIYYLAKEASISTSNFRTFAQTVCILSGLVALFGIFEASFKFNPIYEYLMPNEYYQRYVSSLITRPMSTQFNPGVLGSFLLAWLPLSLFLHSDKNRNVRLISQVSLTLSIVVIILIFSRSALLGLLVIATYYLYNQKKFRFIILPALIFLMVVLACSFLPYPFSKFGLRSLTYGENGLLSTYRLERFKMVFRMIWEHPWAGVGFQHFRIRFYEYYSGKSAVPYEKMIADNMYLTILAETGIIGFCSFVVFIVSLLKKGFQAIKVYDDQRKNAIRAVIAGLISILIGMGGYELFYWPSPFFIFCILCGMLAGLSQKALNEQRNQTA